MNIGKKILSAFVEVTEEASPPLVPERRPTASPPTVSQPAADSGKFVQHFEQLFAEANLPGPDYYEFSKMVEAMQLIPDEKARYIAAFAGLQVQGLSREKLLETAAEYLKMVAVDAAAFQQTLSVALQEKVKEKQEAAAEKKQRIQQLSQEIAELQTQVETLQTEIGENEAKITGNSEAYAKTAAAVKAKIQTDIERINRHLGAPETQPSITN